jgi:hypothetical protein
MNWFSSRFCCFFFVLALWLQVYIHGRVALWAWGQLFLLASSYVYFHCSFAFHSELWCFFIGLVIDEKCRSLYYSELKSVFLKGGTLLQEKAKCFAKFSVVGNFWTFF